MAVTDRQRWLALGLLLLVLSMAYLLLVHPWWTAPMREVGGQIQQSQERQRRVRTQLAQAPEVDRHLAEAEELLAGHPGFMSEPTVELASAALVQQLEATVRQASPGSRGCAISNRLPLPGGTGEERFPRVAVRVSLHCGMAETVALLHALESGSPRLFVDNLNILSQAGAYPAQDPLAAGLGVTFDLYGYIQSLPAPTGGDDAP